MSTPAMSTPATWCRDVHSRDFSAPDGIYGGNIYQKF